MRTMATGEIAHLLVCFAAAAPRAQEATPSNSLRVCGVLQHRVHRVPSFFRAYVVTRSYSVHGYLNPGPSKLPRPNCCCCLLRIFTKFALRHASWNCGSVYSIELQHTETWSKEVSCLSRSVSFVPHERTSAIRALVKYI